MTKSASTTLLVVILIISFFPVVSNAQLLFNKGFERPNWALEAAYYFNSTSYDMQGITDNFAAKKEMYKDNPTYAINEINDVDPLMDTDFELGMRYKRFHFGLAYSTLNEISANFELRQDSFQTRFNDYSIKASSREFRIYGGYMHPLTNWLDIGAYGSVGLGNAKGHHIDEISSPMDPIDTDQVKGDYTPWRVEGRATLHISKIVAVSFAGGYRFAEVTNMGYDDDLVDGRAAITYVEDGEVYTTDFDWSGTFYSVGITLKNPYEK